MYLVGDDMESKVTWVLVQKDTVHDCSFGINIVFMTK